MAKLTKAENENIILYNELEDTANISTYNAGLRNRLALFAEKHPELCRQTAAYDQGGAAFIIVNPGCPSGLCSLTLMNVDRRPAKLED